MKNEKRYKKQGLIIKEAVETTMAEEGITLTKLAHIFAITRTCLYNYMNGRRAPTKKAREIAQRLGINVLDILP